MMEKILKSIYITPKVELNQDDYNHLVSMAQMKAKKIEQRARELYEKEGIAKIAFQCSIERRRYGEVENERYEFDCSCGEYGISPTGWFEDKGLFVIPQKSREKIAKHVKNICTDVFAYYFGDHMLNLNEIERLKRKQKRLLGQFIIWTIAGWMLSLFLLIVVFAR